MSVTIPLELDSPLPAAPMLAALAAHSLPRIQVTTIDGATDGVEDPHAHDDRGAGARGSVRRVLRIDGAAVAVEVQISDDAVQLRLAASTSPTHRVLAVERVRRWLDLDLEPSEVHAALGADPRLAPLIAARPGLRIVGHPDPFEAAVSTVIGQRVSLAAGRVFGARLVEHLVPAGELVEFPAPEVVAAADPGELRAAIGLTASRARCVIELAARCAEGLDLVGGDPARVRAELLAVPGIGPWTVEYLAVRVLGDRDAFPAGDLVLQRALGVTSARAAQELAEPWRPWRAYALFHLWTEETYCAPGPRRTARRQPTEP